MIPSHGDPYGGRTGHAIQPAEQTNRVETVPGHLLADQGKIEVQKWPGTTVPGFLKQKSGETFPASHLDQWLINGRPSSQSFPIRLNQSRSNLNPLCPNLLHRLHRDRLCPIAGRSALPGRDLRGLVSLPNPDLRESCQCLFPHRPASNLGRQQHPTRWSFRSQCRDRRPQPLRRRQSHISTKSWWR